MTIRNHIETMIAQLNAQAETETETEILITVDREALEKISLQGEIDGAFWLSDGYEVFYM